MLSIKCTTANATNRVYEMTDSATGMSCSYHDVAGASDKFIAWVEANANLLIARATQDIDFAGSVPKSE